MPRPPWFLETISSMLPDRNSSCLALACAPDGTIVDVLRDDFRIACPGKRLPDVVDGGSAAKAEKLMAALRERQSSAGWLLNVPMGDGARTLSFAGIAHGQSFLLLASAVPEPAADLYDELSRLNNEVINRERELARRGAALERVSAEKSRLMAIAAHDLRNPLTVVAAYADLLLNDRALVGEHLAYVEEISRSARFMMELVEEMLDSARLESGHVDLELNEIDLVAAARHAATTNRLRADRKAIAIDFVPETGQALIRADAVKLRQIMNNLVVNAIKFSRGGTTVTIRVRATNACAILEVEDQGIGIAPESLGTIFEPFHTLSDSGTAGEKSTGLGLAIVKQLAELHDATIEVESREGKGSLFRVAFPRSTE